MRNLNPMPRVNVPSLFGLLASIVLMTTGCGKESEPNTVPVASTSVDKSLRLNADELKIDILLENNDPIVANNAKQLLEAYQRNDYSKAAFAMTTIASLRVDPASQRVIQETLVKLMKVTSAAAAEGDANAKFAETHLNQTFNR